MSTKQRKAPKRLGYVAMDTKGNYLVGEVTSRAKARKEVKELNHSYPMDHHVVVEIWTSA